MNALRYAAPFVLMLGLFGCSDGDAADPVVEPEPQPLLTCVEDDMDPGEWRGPEWDATTGEMTGEPLDRYWVHTTLAVLKPEKADRFFELTVAVLGRFNEFPGLVAGRVAISEKCNTARTVGIWRTRGAIYDLVMTEEHVAAMNETDELTDLGVTTSWEVAASEVPLSWDAAHAALEAAHGTPPAPR